MTKVRKQKKRKSYQYHVNRKRMSKKRFSFKSSETINNKLTQLLSTEKKFKRAGLVFDVNEDIKSLNQPNTKTVKKKAEVESSNELISQLEDIAKSVAHKQSNMSNDQLEYFNRLIKKHGDNYQAMSRDNQNYLQLTWKQLRTKIKTFKKCIKKNKYQ